MAFVVKGLYELDESFQHLALMSEEIYDEMLHAAAEEIREKTEQCAVTMLVGPYFTGDLAQNIEIGRIRKNNKNGRYTDVIFKGKVRDAHHSKGERRAKIAFINEYGTRKQPARPFISTAVRNGSDDAVQAAATIYFAELDKIL